MYDLVYSLRIDYQNRRFLFHLPLLVLLEFNSMQLFMKNASISRCAMYMYIDHTLAWHSEPDVVSPLYCILEQIA